MVSHVELRLIRQRSRSGRSVLCGTSEMKRPKTMLTAYHGRLNATTSSIRAVSWLAWVQMEKNPHLIWEAE